MTVNFDLGNPNTTTGVCSNFTKVNETSDIAMTWVNGTETHSMTFQFKVGKDNSTWYFSKIGVVISFVTENGESFSLLIFSKRNF